MKSETVKANKNGLMDRNMKVNGEMERQMVRANCIMQTVTFMKANGLTIKQMETELIHMLTEQNT